jgi:hypothetical protein
MTDIGQQFRDDLELLSEPLRTRHQLTITRFDYEYTNGWHYGIVVLSNQFVELRFVAGAPREQHVAAAMHFADSNGNFSSRGYSVQGYASRLGISDAYFPESASEAARGRFYGFGSRVQLIANIVFLSACCTEILNGNKTAIDSVVSAFRHR